MTLVDIDRERLAQQFTDWCQSIGFSPAEFESFVAWENDKTEKGLNLKEV